MQSHTQKRWWYSDEKHNESDKVHKSRKAFGKKSEKTRKYKFMVMVNFDLNPYEKVAVTGGCDELGNWDNDLALLLDQENDKIWSVVTQVPFDETVDYRYFIASIDPSNQSSIHVRKWETHLKTRFVPRSTEPESASEIETFGVVDGVEKIDKGWLTNETILQFKFFNNPFHLKERIKNRMLYVKLTAMNLRINAETANSQIDESMSNDTRETGDQPAYAFCEVATLNGEDFTFQPQEQFGRPYRNDDIQMFHITVTEPENIAYLIDLYTYKRGENGEPPHHLGYHYLLPNLLKKSEGVLELPITCASRHRPLGMMKIEFVKITPLNDPNCDMKISFARYWNEEWKGLDVGHRGTGTSFKVTSGGSIRENTIASLKKAGDSGADLVEFDVQLSKDLHPVIYHDFRVYVSLKKKVTMDANDMLELPMRELTLEQLKNLKVYHVAEAKTREPKFFDEDLAEHQPFPELAEALTVIEDKIGFNIEVKWAQLLDNGATEDHLEGHIDKNLYVDRILEVVLSKAANRRIIFSCFDADICVMLRNKQNIFPVMFLVLGETTIHPKYYNPCGNTFGNAVKFSVANELLGIVAHTEDLLRDISQVNLAKDLGLIVFCWGDDNNSKDTIKYLKDKGLHAIIYDKVDVLIEAKERLFYVASKESQVPLLEQIDLEHRQNMENLDIQSY